MAREAPRRGEGLIRWTCAVSYCTWWSFVAHHVAARLGYDIDHCGYVVRCVLCGRSACGAFGRTRALGRARPVASYHDCAVSRRAVHDIFAPRTRSAGDWLSY